MDKPFSKHRVLQGESQGVSLSDALQNLQLLRNFSGDSGAFWELYLNTLMASIAAEAGVICLRNPQGEWLTLAYAPKTAGYENYIRIFLSHISILSEKAFQEGCALQATTDYLLASIPLVLDSKNTQCLFIGYIPQSQEPLASHILGILRANADHYAQYRIRKSVHESVNLKQNLLGILEVGSQLNKQSRFLAGAMTLVNEMASRYQCERASLGWLQRGYVRIKAMSHSDSFDKKMEVVRQLEFAMEEALEQDSDITYPLTTDTRVVGRAHDTYARSVDAGHMLSMVLRENGDPVAVCTLERKATPFTEEDVRLFRITMDQATPRLSDLKQRDRWFGARWASSWKSGLAKLVGVEHTWAKVLCTLAFLFILFAAFFPIPYRVDAPMILRTDKVLFVTAPFAGYIDSVSVRPGDLLVQGQELLRLEQNQLLLQEADLEAEARNYEREIQKAQADEELAQIRIYTAKLEQANAKLNTVRYQLDQSILRSPFHNAVVVEGDLAKKTGAPVNQGEELFRIAMIQNIYAEVNVEEEEIRNLLEKQHGQIALKSRPENSYAIQVVRINPTANVKDQANVFQVRGEFTQEIPNWFRPGMTGIAKIDAGDRTLWWILSHRTIDFLLLKLWW